MLFPLVFSKFVTKSMSMLNKNSEATKIVTINKG